MRNMVRLFWLLIALLLAVLGFTGKLEIIPTEWVIVGVVLLALSFGLVEYLERRKR
jgi:hypothetical protein